MPDTANGQMSICGVRHLFNSSNLYLYTSLYSCSKIILNTYFVRAFLQWRGVFFMITTMLVVGLFLSLILIILEKDDWVVAFETNESHVGDAQTILSLFRAHRIKTHYYYRMNYGNFSFTFKKYKEGKVTIKVHKKDQEAAREALLKYNIVQRQKEHCA